MDLIKINNNIEVMVIELTNKCDLDCIFCPSVQKERSLKYKLLKKIINENKKLEHPIRILELSGMGNPLLHKNIKGILELFKENDFTVSIVTNGFYLKDIIAYFDDTILQNVHFSIYLDSPDEEKNDYLMGKKAFKRTIESLEYLTDRRLRHDIRMRVTPTNYNEIENMIELCNYYKCTALIPIDIFPLGKANSKDILDDEKKKIVINTIENLMKFGLPIYKCIHFENPSGNCTYLRLKRLFINSKGIMSFCHFLSSLPNTEISSVDNKNFIKIIKKSNNLYSNFAIKKEKKMKSWKLPRMTSSPCSYCLNNFGVKLHGNSMGL
jgi:MoaA/NifB/PqqE/SkfB family radical SAM enzyme